MWNLIKQMNKQNKNKFIDRTDVQLLQGKG